MSMQDSPVFCHLLVDTQSKTERTTEAILKQNGWKFIQDGRYTSSSPLTISSGSKTKLTFSLTQLAYQDGRLLDLAYNQSSNKFMPTQVGATYLANIRFKAKSSSQNNILVYYIQQECKHRTFHLHYTTNLYYARCCD